MPMKFNFFQQLRAVCDGPGRKWGQEPDVASHSTHVEPMYYEVLDISLQELEQLKTLKVGSSRPHMPRHHRLEVSSGTGCCCSVCFRKALLCVQLGLLVAALLSALLPALCTLPPALLFAAATLQ